MKTLLLVALVLVATPALAAPCGYLNAHECATWCGEGADSSCTASSTSYCIYHNRSYIECGYVRTVVTCTCTLTTNPPQLPYTAYETPTLDGNGFLLECENGVGFEEGTGSAYCLPPEEGP